MALSQVRPPIASLASPYSFCADQPAVSSLSPPRPQPPSNTVAATNIRASKLRFMGKNYTAEEELDWEEAPQENLSAVLPEELAGQRMDLALAQLFPQFSRNRLQVWLKSGHVLVDGRQPQASAKTIGGEKVEITAPPAADVAAPKAQRMALDIVFEDADLIVV